MNKKQPELDANESELSAYHPAEWDDDAAVVAGPVPDPGAVYAVRFSSDEIEAISRAAEDEGLSTSAYIRRAALAASSAGRAQHRSA